MSNILEEQEEVFATHMAAIKEDAKLLTQESELISKIQGVGFMDYDVDSYVDKLEGIIKKKMKMYTLLTKKVENFKKYLKEEDEMRHKVKETFYYWHLQVISSFFVFWPYIFAITWFNLSLSMNLIL